MFFPRPGRLGLGLWLSRELCPRSHPRSAVRFQSLERPQQGHDLLQKEVMCTWEEVRAQRSAKIGELDMPGAGLESRSCTCVHDASPSWNFMLLRTGENL